MPDPIPMHPKPTLAPHEDNPPHVRDQAAALNALAGRIARVLTSNAALPAMRAQAKAELVTLAQDALELWRGM